MKIKGYNFFLCVYQNRVCNFFLYQFIRMPIKSKYLLLLLVSGFLQLSKSQAQTDLKAWGTASFQLPAGKKSTLSIEHLRSYNTSQKWENEFNQVQGRLGVDLGHEIDLYVGDLITLTPGSNEIKNRVFVRGTHKIKLGKTLRWQNGLQAEMHSKNENRYQYRFVVSSRFNLKKRFSSLKLAPSVTGFVFYNIGGKELQYYDNNKQPVVKQTPDGFHRARLLFNLNSKINDRFNIGLYYMVQREFNFLNDPTHHINYFNPVTRKIVRPFENYNVAGLTLGINLGKDINNEPMINN
jgi:hypothetical protein